MLRTFFFAFALFFVGCGSHLGVTFKQQEESYIQATRKTELIVADRVQIVLIATHLNAFNAQDYPHQKGEFFFIDAYQSRQNGKTLFENGYTLSLENGEKPLKITQLSREELQDFMQENATKWGEYYLVEFAPQNQFVQNSLQLFITHKEYGSNFSKFGFKALNKESLRDKN